MVGEAECGGRGEVFLRRIGQLDGAACQVRGRLEANGRAGAGRKHGQGVVFLGRHPLLHRAEEGDDGPDLVRAAFRDPGRHGRHHHALLENHEELLVAELVEDGGEVLRRRLHGQRERVLANPRTAVAGRAGLLVVLGAKRDAGGIVEIIRGRDGARLGLRPAFEGPVEEVVLEPRVRRAGGQVDAARPDDNENADQRHRADDGARHDKSPDETKSQKSAHRRPLRQMQ